MGPDVLGSSNLSERLKSFDREALTDEYMAKVEEVLQDPDYN